MLKSPGAIAFSIYSVDVHWYGIIMAFAILCGIFTVLAIRKKYYQDIKEDSILDISFLLIISGIIFARLYYVLLDYRYFIKHIHLIPCIWTGGLAIHGAIIGGILAFFIYAKHNKLEFLRYADLFTFGLLTGQIIGRWGNFFNSEAFGLPTNFPVAVYIPYNYRPIEYQEYALFHPTFLYESVLNAILLIILLLILKNKKEIKNGLIFFTYLTLYSIIRILIETIRIDSVLNISIFHAAHIASAIILIIGLSGLIFIHKRNE